MQAAPTEIARLVAPILVKASLTGQEPMAFKHCRLAEVSKAAGDPYANKGYRAVTVCNVFAKHHYSFLRSQLAHSIDIMLRDSQLGGRARRSPTMASHQARLISSILAVPLR